MSASMLGLDWVAVLRRAEAFGAAESDCLLRCLEAIEGGAIAGAIKRGERDKENR